METTIMFTSQMVRELKGAALSVLVLLLLNPEGVSQEFLERQSGYTDKPISQALQYLKETCRVVKTRSGWKLAIDLQLPLSYCLPDELDTVSPSRKNSDSIIIINSGNELNTDDIVNNNNNGRKNSDSQKVWIPELHGGKSLEEWNAVWAELGQACLLHNDTTDELAARQYMTPDYVRGWVLKMKRDQQGGSRWTGLLVKYLQSGSAAPELNEHRHLKDCTCKTCRPELVDKSEFAEYLAQQRAEREE